MHRIRVILVAALLVPALARAQLQQLKPGWNLFSAQQDVQLGREASAELQKQIPVVHNRELNDYLNVILRKLEPSPYARTLNRDGSRSEMFPFTIQAVHSKVVNAYSLPGGPIFVNTGLIEACENEAQLAGVISHEMSHVVLRHSTNQASKQNLIALPALLAGALVGNSMLGQLAKVGIGVGANSVLLKFSRADESEADYNGAEIMADAGYNPLELANFFEKLEAKAGRQNGFEQFLSDHPNPGNRVAAMHNELQYLPRRKYVTDETGQFEHIKDLVHHLAAPGQLRGSYGDDSHAPSAPTARPSSRLLSYRGQSFSLDYPDNWQVFGDRQANTVTIAPREGLVQGSGGNVAVGYGLETSYYFPQASGVDLNRDTQALIRQLRQSNAGMHIARDARNIEVDGHPALLTTLYSTSPYRGEQEVDVLVTVSRPDGLFYLIFIAPQSEFDQIQRTFEDILRSVRLN
ncbi:MAG TPA: M48 family metalloprotease [Bryobacteraceae bacterium]|nr:M48 family metalloprotease [Bryobacteraceae bacterium]